MSQPVSPAPGRVGWACGRVLRATWVMATGTEEPGTWPRSGWRRSSTASTSTQPTASPRRRTPACGHEVGRGHGRRAGRSVVSVCNVWVGLQVSDLADRGEVLASDEAVMRSTFAVAYDSVLPTWKWFLARAVESRRRCSRPAGRGDSAPAQT